MPTLIDELRSFVTDNFLFGQTDGLLTDETSFLEQGIIDSTGLLELIGFVERTYGIRLADEELVPDNLDSLQKLAGFVSRKQSGTTGASTVEYDGLAVRSATPAGVRV
jgi:acyl carrier protein